MTQEHRRRLWGASRARAPKNRETYAFISFYHIFHKKNLDSPHIFDKSMPVLKSTKENFMQLPRCETFDQPVIKNIFFRFPGVVSAKKVSG